MGFDVLEISSGFLSIPTESWINLIEDTKKHDLKPKPEVGIQYVTVRYLIMVMPTHVL